jgi:thioredoxin 1
MATELTDVTDDDFDASIIDSAQPALVDFWAPWCGPCKAIAPAVSELSGIYGDRIGFFKCNVDENQKTPATYGIRAIPTLIVFKDGKVFDQVTGMVSRTQIDEMLRKALSGETSTQPFIVQS